MDKQNSDQWMRDALKDYAPVPGKEGRATFLDAAAGKTAVGKSFWKSKYFVWVLAFLAFTTSIMFYMFSGSKSDSLPQSEKNPITQSLSSNKQAQAENISESTSENTLAIATKMLKEELKQNQAFVTDSQPATELESVSAKIENLQQLNDFDLNAPFEQQNLNFIATANNESQSPNNELIVPIGEESTVSAGEESKSRQLEESSIEKSIIPYNFSSEHRLEYFLYYQPELIYNIIENNKLTHNIGFDVAYRFFNRRYSFRTGLALSISEGYYEYATQFNEFLGKYERLDSITFAWDQRQFNLIPTVYTSETDAFSDDVRVSYASVYKRHYYVQVPMIVGYDFWRKNNWQLGVRTGARLSVLADTQTLTFLPDNGNNKIIQINQITPDRIKTNWQLVAGLNLTHHTRNHWMIGLEPEIAYFFNSVYETPNINKAPWSLSMRLSIGFY